jgi:hypothetical protein
MKMSPTGRASQKTLPGAKLTQKLTILFIGPRQGTDSA